MRQYAAGILTENYGLSVKTNSFFATDRSEMGIKMKYQYWLSNIEGIGPKTIQKILHYVESAEELYSLTEIQIDAMSELKDAERKRILSGRRGWNVEKEWERFLKTGISFVSQESERFPEKLRYIENPPYSIYYKGDLPDERYKSFAIVGARQCSEYGRLMAEKLAEALAERCAAIISGMARGVDSYAHIGALRGKGYTFAVLGCGVDICYPSENKKLYEEIAENGGILSEYPPQTAPNPRLFPARNRIISALSDTIVLVEAKERSGSLITADFALEQGKDIFACPGRTTDALSAGCNALIRQGAGIITSVDSFLKDMGFHGNLERFQDLSLEKDESMLYSCLDFRPRSLEELSLRTGMKIQYVSNLIQGMTGKGIVKEIFRNYYIKMD